MAKKKTKKGKRGRPSKGPTVSVTLSMSKSLVERVNKLRTRVKTLRSRTAAIEAAVRAGLEREERYWKTLDGG